MKPFYLKKILATIIFSMTSFLYSENFLPPTNPEQEEQILMASGMKPITPLSEALPLLIKGISENYFGKDLINKITQAEASHFTGTFIDHWENGQKKITAPFKNGKVDGHLHGWFPDGEEAFKGFFYENKKVGIHIAFYPNEVPRRASSGLARVLAYWDGILEGTQKARYYDGHLKTILRYKNGVLNGETGLYSQDGTLIKKEWYENGKFIK